MTTAGENNICEGGAIVKEAKNRMREDDGMGEATSGTLSDSESSGTEAACSSKMMSCATKKAPVDLSWN